MCRRSLIFAALLQVGCALAFPTAIATRKDIDRRLHERAAKVLVTSDSTLERNFAVVGVLDFHTPAASEDKGFDALRLRAAQLDANAVIEAQFEHGDGREDSHLSGTAVRYVSLTPPLDPGAYDVIGRIDVVREPDDEDTGWAELLDWARLMGADDLLDVRFVHGEGGGKSHLTAVAVKHHSE